MRPRDIFHRGIILLLSSGLGNSSWAEDPSSHSPHTGQEGGIHVHGSHPECPLPKSSLEVVRCAQENHPLVLRAKLTSTVAETGPAVAKLIPNPEMEVQSVFGEATGSPQMQTQSSIVQPLEIGGKRSARVQRSEAEIKQAEANTLQAQAEVILQTVLNLHRLRQLLREEAIFAEAIQVFSKLIEQRKVKPRLAPEQSVSLEVFEMAKSDAEIRQSTLFEEEKRVEHFFHIATGHSLRELIKVLPKAPETWPTVEDRTIDQISSPRVFRLLADRELSQAELEIARAASWPTFKIGPMIQLQREGSVSFQMYGLQLNLELPLWQINGPGRAQALKRLETSEELVRLVREEDAHERAELVQVYQNAVEALKKTIPLSELSRKHHKVENLILRGLVSSSLVIEAHRQLAELQLNHHGKEIKAIEALWQIYKLDGHIFKVPL